MVGHVLVIKIEAFAHLTGSQQHGERLGRSHVISCHVLDLRSIISTAILPASLAALSLRIVVVLSLGVTR